MSDQLGLWHAGDPPTSRLAALDNYPRIGTQRRAVLAEVALDPGTAAELAYRLGWRSAASGNSAAKRLSELKQDGLVAATGERRPTSMGSLADEYAITPEGRAALA